MSLSAIHPPIDFSTVAPNGLQKCERIDNTHRYQTEADDNFSVLDYNGFLAIGECYYNRYEPSNQCPAQEQIDPKHRYAAAFPNRNDGRNEVYANINNQNNDQ